MIIEFNNGPALVNLDIFTNIFYIKTKFIIITLEINTYDTYSTTNKYAKNFDTTIDPYLYVGDFFDKTDDDFYVYKIKFYNYVYINTIYVVCDEEPSKNKLFLEYEPNDFNEKEINECIKIRNIFVPIIDSESEYENIDFNNVDISKIQILKYFSKEINEFSNDNQYNENQCNEDYDVDEVNLFEDIKIDYNCEIKYVKNIDREKYGNSPNFYIKILFSEDIEKFYKLKIFFDRNIPPLIVSYMNNFNIEYIKVL